MTQDTVLPKRVEALHMRVAPGLAWGDQQQLHAQQQIQSHDHREGGRAEAAARGGHLVIEVRDARDDQPVPARPGKAIEAMRNVGADDFVGRIGGSLHERRLGEWRGANQAVQAIFIVMTDSLWPQGAMRPYTYTLIVQKLIASKLTFEYQQEWQLAVSEIKAYQTLHPELLEYWRQVPCTRL